MKTSQQLVLVTGAYSGIGLSIVNHLLKTTDYSVLMTSRSKSLSDLEELLSL